MNKHLYLSASFLTDTQHLWVAQISVFEHQINPVFSSQTRPIKWNEIKALFISSFSTSVKCLWEDHVFYYFSESESECN